MERSGLRTISEKRQLLTDGVIDTYLEVWDTQVLSFPNFTIPWDPYIPKWVAEFHEAYSKVILKSRGRVKITPKPINSVEVRGVQVLYSKIDINDVLGCTYRYFHDLTEILSRSYRDINDGIESWLAPTISIRPPSSLEEGAIIEKKELNVMAQFWFWFINSNLMPSQNELILQHSKMALVEYIMDCRKLNLGSIIASKIFKKAKQL